MIDSRIHKNKIQIVVSKTEKEIIKQFQEEFSVYKPGYQFTPRFRSGLDDGKYKFYTVKSIGNSVLFELEIGFIDKINKFFKTIMVGIPMMFEKNEITDFLKKEIPKLPFKPRKYQLKMIYGMLQNQIHLGILSTGGGKSLVAYLVIKFLLNKNQKTILIVPTIDLVSQMFSDFKEYGADQTFLEKIQLIGGDYKDKNLHKPIVISTWQSLNNVKRESISGYDCLYVDEAHKAKANILSDILKSKVHKKIGQTGSLPIVEIDSMKLQEIFGDPKIYATAKDLIDLGLLTKTTVIALFLNYPKRDTRSGLKYQEEVKFIREYKPRIRYTSNLIDKVSKTGITVCTYNTTKFGESLYEQNTGKPLGRDRNNFERQKDRGVFFISGKTKPSLREQIRQYLNSPESKNEKLIAQTTTFDTGINIPKLKNFIFGEAPGKSFTKILQSIGRVMRKSDSTGNNVYIWDLVDCFAYSRENYTLQHFWDRQKYYQNEQHPIQEKEIEI